MENSRKVRVFLDLLKTSEAIHFPGKGSFRKIDFSKKDLARIDKIAKDREISKQEAFSLLLNAGLKSHMKAEKSG